MQRHNKEVLSQAGSFRADIEGLRAVAVLGVVIFHALPGVLPGGFVGVDVFFVISGYLITQLLLRELSATGKISLSRFWARRARRILPAASLVLIFTVVAAALLLPTLEQAEAGEGVQAAGIFVENWRLIGNAVDYLKQDFEPSVVLHYWSLAIEEQFYLIWPITLIMLASAGKTFAGITAVIRLLFISLLCLWLLSFGLSAYYATTLQPFAFFSTPTRAWQLLSGAFLAFFAGVSDPLSPRLRSFLLVLAISVLLASMVFITSETPYPGWVALVPTLAACCLIAFGGIPTAPIHPGRLLAMPPLTYLGRLSYSWYLWHWPFLVFGSLALGGATTLERIFLAFAALGLAAITYHFVENPIRFNVQLMRSPSLSLFMGAVLVSVSVSAGAALVNHTSSALIVLSNGTRIDLQEVTRSSRMYAEGCNVGKKEAQYGVCSYGKPTSNKVVVLLGDSHAAQYFPPLEEAARTLGWKLLVRTKGGCPPTDLPLWDSDLNRVYSECGEWRARVLKEIDASKPRLIIVGGSGRYTLWNAKNESRIHAHEAIDKTMAGERRFIERLRNTGGSVIILRDNPKLPQSAPDCLIAHPRQEDKCAWPRGEVLKQPRFPYANLDDSAQIVRTIDLTDKVCDSDKCYAARGSRVVMSDRHHFTIAFARSFAPIFVELLREAETP